MNEYDKLITLKYIIGKCINVSPDGNTFNIMQKPSGGIIFLSTDEVMYNIDKAYYELNSYHVPICIDMYNKFAWNLMIIYTHSHSAGDLPTWAKAFKMIESIKQVIKGYQYSTSFKIN